MHAAILALLFVAPPNAPPVEPPVAPPVEILDAASLRPDDAQIARVVEAWESAGIDCETQVTTPSGGRCDLVECECADCPHETAPTGPPLRIVVWATRHCPHGERALREVVPALRAAGWVAGRDYEIVRSDYGQCPQFYFRGVPFSRSGYPGVVAWMRSLKQAMGASQRVHEATRQDAGDAGESPSHVQVNAGRGTATGVCVGERDGRSLVLTNHHVCHEGGQPAGVPSVYLDGRWIPGELIASDNDADLALFSVPANLRPVAIADAQPAAGSQVRTYGYGGGRHTPRVTVTLAGYPGGGQMVGCCLTRLAFVPGESGSAVMHDDRLVGLVTGRDPSGRFGVVVDLPSIRSFLSREGVL